MAVVLGTNSGFVTVAPTADPAGTGTTLDGNAVVTKDTTPANAVRITSIGWYRASGTNAANWEIALYSDLAGVPVTRLFVDATNSTTSAGWITTAVDWAVSASTPYWLALQMDAHSGSSQVDAAASGGAGSDLFAATTLATPYAGGTVADADGMYAIYALLEVSSTPYSAEATTPSFAATAQGITRLNAFAAAVTAPSAAMAASAVSRINEYLAEASSAAFAWIARAVSAGVLFAAEATAASFALTAQASTWLAHFAAQASAGQFGFAAQQITRLIAFIATATAASVGFVASAASHLAGAADSVAASPQRHFQRIMRRFQ